MELVYLWVEEYKNIRNQGFNFSPRFEFEYIQDKNELILKKENKDYVSIFPDNINVTAIVGENGSGKSSILNIILEIVEEEIKNKYILIFNDDSLQYISNFKFETDLIENKNFLTYQNIFAYINKIHKSYLIRKYNVVEIDKRAIANILTVEHGKPNSKFQISSFMYLPNQIEIKLRTFDDLINENIILIIGLKKEKEEEIKKIFQKLEDEYHKFLFICYIKEKKYDLNIDILNDRNSLEREITDKLIISDFLKYFLPLTNEKIFNISDLTEEQKNIYIKEDGYFHFFDFDMIYKTDKEEIRFNNLSHGEQMIFGQLLNIYFLSNSSSNEKLIFLFDEPEIALHPKWQKNYINEIYNLFNKLGKNYHFIFTSHSPFLLSDLPKKNVIFLEKYKKDEDKNQKEGNCKNATKEIKLKTFGANIHSLLSDGFFMCDGLMGEFAKKTIQDVINYLDDNPTQNMNKQKAWQIIQLVGEPFLKHKLEEKYNEKFLTQKEQKLNKIKQLEDELKRLRDDNTQS